MTLNCASRFRLFPQKSFLGFNFTTNFSRQIHRQLPPKCRPTDCFTDAATRKFPPEDLVGRSTNLVHQLPPQHTPRISRENYEEVFLTWFRRYNTRSNKVRVVKTPGGSLRYLHIKKAGTGMFRASGEVCVRPLRRTFANNHKRPSVETAEPNCQV